MLSFASTANITGSWNAATGTLNLTGIDTVADYQAVLRSVTYIDTSSNPSGATRTVSFEVNDGLAESNVVTRNIAVQVAGPTVATPAAITPNPVTGTRTNLSVLGADSGGEVALTYTWTATSEPSGAAAPTYSDNGDNTAKNTTATFYDAGAYVFQVTITDAGGLSTTSSVTVTVDQTLTSITVTPATPALASHATQQFTASGFDQFGNAMSLASTTWSVTAGSITSSGLFTAPYASAAVTVTANSGSVNGTTLATVTNSAPTVTTAAGASPNPVTGTTTALSVFGEDDAGESNLTYTWATTGTPPAAVSFSANGSNAAKNTTATFSKAGSYTFQVTITDGGGLSTTSSVTVTVNQTLTSISNTSQPLATTLDQFGNPLASQPAFNAGSDTITGPLALGSNVTVLPAAGSQLTISGGITGTGGLTVNAPGKVILSGADSYTGGTTVSAGTLIVANASAVPDGSSLTVGLGGTFVFDPSQTASNVSPAGLAVPAPGTAAASEISTSLNTATAPAEVPMAPSALSATTVYAVKQVLAVAVPLSRHSRTDAPTTPAPILKVASDAVFASHRSAFDQTISPADNAQFARAWGWLAAIESLLGFHGPRHDNRLERRSLGQGSCPVRSLMELR